MDKGSAGLQKELASCLQDYTCGSSDNSITAEGSFIFPALFPAFQGHFPGQPILPGIIELNAVRYLASLCLGCGLKPFSCNNIKFNGLIRPEQQIDLILNLTGLEDNAWENHFRITSDSRKISRGVITYHKSWY